jgi:hypothetical protein
MRDIYELKLGQHSVHNNLYITRVPGGWVFEVIASIEENAVSPSICFVPYSDEFEKENN